MTPERIEKKAQKRQDRRGRNLIGKILKAEQRQKALVELGKTVIEVKDGEGGIGYDFPSEPKVRDIPNRSLLHIAAKTYKKAAAPRKTRLRFKVEHAEAIVEEASRSLAQAIEQAQADNRLAGLPSVSGEVLAQVPEFQPGASA